MPAGKRKAEPVEVPAFTSDRLKLMGPLITSEVLALARHRIATGESFFVNAKLVVDAPREVARIALLVAHEMNPWELFHGEEEALIRGRDADTVRKRKTEPGFRHL